LLTTTDALSHASTNEYDDRYRLVKITDAKSGVTQFTLDPAGNRTALVDSVNNETDWTYNGCGGALPGQGRAGSLDACRAVEFPVQSGVQRVIVGLWNAQGELSK
jgi:YD repeat-containing protein